MQQISIPSLVTCATPTCGAQIPFTESTYIDGARQLRAVVHQPTGAVGIRD